MSCNARTQSGSACIEAAHNGPMTGLGEGNRVIELAYDVGKESESVGGKVKHDVGLDTLQHAVLGCKIQLCAAQRATS
jgi:hypothetical protein